MTKTDTTIPTTKAARMLAIAELQRLGLLDGVSYQTLGELLGCDRATAFRARRDLATTQALLPELLAKARRLLATDAGRK
jgi:hypothetical protein